MEEMRLFELLVKVAKGELPEGTKIIQIDCGVRHEYIIKNTELRWRNEPNLSVKFCSIELADVVIIENLPIKEIPSMAITVDSINRSKSVADTLVKIIETLNEVIRRVNKQ